MGQRYACKRNREKHGRLSHYHSKLLLLLLKAAYGWLGTSVYCFKLQKEITSLKKLKFKFQALYSIPFELNIMV